MKELTAERVRELLAYDPETGILTRRTLIGRWHDIGDPVGYMNASGYLEVGIARRQYRYHRVVWLHVHGHWPIGDIDHINGIKTDNRIVNLRDIPHRANMQNMRSATRNNLSGFLGVSLMKSGRYVAQIRLKNRTKYLGTFSNPEEAHEAYLLAKRQLHEGNTL